MKKALISVSDKTGIAEFAQRLEKLNIEIISTGGTYKSLIDSGVGAVSVDSVTGFAECLDGRVKTLHPAIHGGILAVRENEGHMRHVASLGIGLIDIVVVNLYPFKNTILKENVALPEVIENIDIGGPAMVRSAAKNYNDVAVLTDPKDYEKILTELEQTGDVSRDTKLYLSAKAFAHTAAYDALIADYMKEMAGPVDFGDTMTLTYEKKSDMRYGENPHQKAAYYKEIRPLAGSLNSAHQLHGKELSFNNINDLNGALALLKEFSRPAAVCVKHSTPCGVGEADDIYSAYVKAYEADPVSVYGGIIALNREVNTETAEKINQIFVEILIAPSYTQESLAILKRKKNIRIMVAEDVGTPTAKPYFDMKKVLGGILIQQADNILYDDKDLKCITKKQPSEKEIQDLIFGFKVVKHVKSNGIVICKNGQTVGIGGGQVSRVWALKQAIEHGVELLGKDSPRGCVLSSDAYFPFGDCVEAAHAAGITAIIQPGGSMRDEESIKLCDEYGISMLFTAIRHFRH